MRRMRVLLQRRGRRGRWWWWRWRSRGRRRWLLSCCCRRPSLRRLRLLLGWLASPRLCLLSVHPACESLQLPLQVVVPLRVHPPLLRLRHRPRRGGRRPSRRRRVRRHTPLLPQARPHLCLVLRLRQYRRRRRRLRRPAAQRRRRRCSATGVVVVVVVGVVKVPPRGDESLRLPQSRLQAVRCRLHLALHVQHGWAPRVRVRRRRRRQHAVVGPLCVERRAGRDAAPARSSGGGGGSRCCTALCGRRNVHLKQTPDRRGALAGRAGAHAPAFAADATARAAYGGDGGKVGDDALCPTPSSRHHAAAGSSRCAVSEGSERVCVAAMLSSTVFLFLRANEVQIL
eukprot:Rhum_TRINITY_DN14773_c30_g1::Rhum_TRINITY_DN14773_c30_g1_i1::g.117392::m.117392